MSQSSKPRRAKHRPQASGGFDPSVHSRSQVVESGMAQLDFPAIALLMSQKLGKPVTADQCRALHKKGIERFRREWLSREAEQRSRAS